MQICFLHKVLKKIHIIQQGLLLICENFNLTPDFTSKSNERDYSFFSSRHCSYSQIDLLFLLDKGSLTKIQTSVINTITWSDHASWQWRWVIPLRIIPRTSGDPIHSSSRMLRPSLGLNKIYWNFFILTSLLDYSYRSIHSLECPQGIYKGLSYPVGGKD